MAENPYMSPTLPADLPGDPMHWAAAWLGEATRRSVQRNPNSMTLATVAEDGTPSARVVLCKSFVEDPGYAVFFTNYESRKIAHINSAPEVALTFHWDTLGRQVRLQGAAVFSPADESDAYFASRDRGSQIGAWGSDQSTELASRQALIDQIRERAQALGVGLSADMQPLAGDDDEPAIPRPSHWGGVRVWPRSIELWIEGANRIHDRAIWHRELQSSGEHDFAAGSWSGTRLQP